MTSEALPLISYDGTVIYVPYKTVPTYCAMDLTLFPYDTQKCIIKLTPWTHNALEIDLGLFGHYLNTTDQMKIPRESLSDLQWELLEGTATLSSKKFDCCPEKYSFFEVSLQMSRKTNFYRYVVTWPSVVACFLVPFLFAIPSHSSQKITYGNYKIKIIFIYFLFVIIMIKYGKFFGWSVLETIFEETNRSKLFIDCGFQVGLYIIIN